MSTPKTRIVLIFAPPGKREAVFSLFQNLIPDAVVHDVDTQIKTKLNAADMKELIEKNSRHRLKDEWRKATERIFDTILSSATNKSKLNILVGHPLYYKNSTEEIFPVFDTSHIKEKAGNEFEISHTILLIDDIFDLYTELSQEGRLYSDRTCYNFMFLYSRAKNVALQNLNNNPEAYTAWIQYCMNLLLQWRAQEIILTQDIADQLKSKFMLWSLKQDPLVLVKWICDKDTKIFYISHPISEPRRTFKTTGSWPKIVTNINNLQVKMKNKELYTVMPTAIDEYRFEKQNNNYTSELSARWPLPDFVKQILSDPRHKLVGDLSNNDILHPYNVQIGLYTITRNSKADINTIQEFLNGIFTALEMTIVGQLSNRDHLLVWLTDGIIVLEPYSVTDNKIHGGIAMELRNLQTVNQSLKKFYPSTQLKKLCAIFSETDVNAIIKSGDFKTRSVSRLRKILKEKHELSDNVIDGLVNNDGDLVYETTSLGTPVPGSVLTEIIKNFTDYQKRAIVEQFLSTAVAMDPQDAEFTMILIVNDIENVWEEQDNISKIKKFLVDCNGYPWQDEIISIAQKQKIIVK